MRLHRLAAFALVALAFAPGCQFYFGGDDDDDCTSYGEPAPYPGAGYVDPATLECRYFGGGGGGGCVHPVEGGAADEAPPPSIDWGTCQNACTGLDEFSCLASDACRGVYVQLEVFDPTEWVEVFQACYPTAPSGPVSGATCEGLNAQECSRHNDCIAVHANVPGDFQFCDRERTVCDPTVPPPPPVQPLRNPESGRCESFGGGGGGCTPPTPGTGGVDVPAHQDWGVCGSPCESLDEASCRMADGCRVIYANQYPPNVDAIGYVFETCWPTAPSGPVRGGSCDGLDAQECSRHDDCIARHDSDWSGCSDPASCDYVAGQFDACTAESAPPPPPPACSTLGEAACDGRADCTPLYAGSDCHCTPSGCTCDTWTFDSCTAD
jgi:hypothetical protein